MAGGIVKEITSFGKTHDVVDDGPARAGDAGHFKTATDGGFVQSGAEIVIQRQPGGVRETGMVGLGE